MSLTLGALLACGFTEKSDGGVDVIQGSVEISAPLPPATSSSAFVVFTPPAAGQLGVTVDWEPQTDRVSFAVSDGVCSTSPCPSEIDMGPFTDGAQQKPISGQAVVSQRLYTLRIDNWGPTAARTTYFVRLVPR